jgi:TonB family protein
LIWSNVYHINLEKEFTVKNMLLPSLFVVFTLLVSPVFAQEGLLKTPSLPEIQNSVPAQFSITITGNGQLAIQPGEAFTEGEEEPGTVLPYLISDPQPVTYPKKAVAQGWEGKVVIAAEILVDGSVGLYQIMQTSGYEVLDETAVQAIKSWKFHPAVKKDGQPFRECIQIPVTFQLQDE